MSFLGQYVDLDYSIWLSRLLTPLAVVFLLPGIIVFLLYFNSLFLYVYKWHRWAPSCAWSAPARDFTSPAFCSQTLHPAGRDDGSWLLDRGPQGDFGRLGCPRSPLSRLRGQRTGKFAGQWPCPNCLLSRCYSSGHLLLGKFFHCGLPDDEF